MRQASGLIGFANLSAKFSVVLAALLLLAGCSFSGSITTDISPSQGSANEIAAIGLPIGASTSVSQISMDISAKGYSSYAYKAAATSSVNCKSEIGYLIVQSIVASSVDISTVADGEVTLCLVGLSEQKLDMANYKSYSFHKDTTAPAAPTSLTLSSPSASPGVSTTPTITVLGLVSGDTIKLYANSTCSAANYRGTATATGASADVTSSDLILDGSYSFYATSQDSLGNVSTCSTATLNYVVMGAQPVATLTGEPTGTNNTVTLNVAVAGTNVTHYKFAVGVSSLDCSNSANYGAEVIVATAITASISAVADGTVKLCVIAKNAAQVWQALSAPTTRTWSKDASGPVWANSIAITAQTSNLLVGPDFTFSTNATDTPSGVLKYQYAIGTGTSGTAASDIKAWTDISASPATGYAMTALSKVTPYYVNMIAIDNLGNSSAINSSSTFKVKLSVSALYASNGANWNDYVKNDGVDVYSSTGTACAGSENGYWACIHGGEKRKVVIDGLTSCTGLTMTDSLGALSWICKVTSGTATFYSVSLNSGMGLGNLINATSWKTNSVTLAGTSSGDSPSNYWWTNSVRLLPNNSASSLITIDATDSDGGTLGDGSDEAFAAGDILTYSASRNTMGYNIALDRISIVKLGDYTLTWNGPGGVNCSADTGSTTTPDTPGTLCSGKKFGWYELKATGTATNGSVLILASATFNRVHASTISSGYYEGIFFNNGAASNGVTESTFANSGESGIWLGWSGASCSYNFFEKIKVVGGGAFNYPGITISSSYNRFNDIQVSYRSGGGGIGFWGSYNTLNNIRISNVPAGGFHFSGGLYNNISNFTISNGGTYAVSLTNNSGGSHYNILTNGTIAFNNGIGVGLYHGRATLHNVVIAKNVTGIEKLSGSVSDSLSHIVVSDNTGLEIDMTYGNPFFHGQLLVENATSCNSTVAGITNTTCVLASSSTGTMSYSGSVLNDLKLAIGVADSVNSGDTNGQAAFPGAPLTFDWFNFESPFRVWGLSATLGQWTTGTADILDFRLKTTGTKIFNNTLSFASQNASFVGGAACPVAVNGDVNILSTADSYQKRFLLNAQEIMLDNIGDDNGLCESGEACLYTPNFGAYQGHGTLATCTFNSYGGLVTGVTMYGYSSNGL